MSVLAVAQIDQHFSVAAIQTGTFNPGRYTPICPVDVPAECDVMDQ